MAVAVSLTVTQVREDGSAGPVDDELAAALAGAVEQFSSMLTWTARQAGSLDHGERETVIGDSGRELQRQLLEATFAIDAAREERVQQVTSAAGIRHGTVEKGHERGVISVFGPVRAVRLAYRNRREANLYPADARWMLPDDPYSLGMRALAAYHLASAGKETSAAHPGIKKMAEIVAVAAVTPAAREPGDIAAPPARRKEHPGPKARDKWVSASITGDIPGTIGTAFDEADRRDPYRTRQRIFLVDGNKQQIAAIAACARDRGLKVPVFIDYIHVSGYIGKAAAALHPGGPQAAGQWADGQLLRVLHGRAKAVAATLASVAAKTRNSPRTRHLDLTDAGKAVTYLTNNHTHMRYDKALAAGWPIATGMIEGACRFVIEDRFGITGARWSPDGAEVILKLRAVVVNGDLDDYMNYYKERYRAEHHLARYDEDTIDRLNLAA